MTHDKVMSKCNRSSKESSQEFRKLNTEYVNDEILRLSSYEYPHLIKENGIGTGLVENKDVSPVMSPNEVVLLGKDEAYLMKKLAPLPEVATLNSINGNKGDEYPVLSPSTKKNPYSDICLDEQLSADLEIKIDTVDRQRRKIVYDALSDEEKEKFTKLEVDAGKHGYSYQAVDIAQFLIVSHLDLNECLTRMEKWRAMLREHLADKVSVAQCLTFQRETDFMSAVGGCDPEGRRIYVINFGLVTSNSVLAEFPVYAKTMNLLWDALAINVDEIRAGVCFIGNFEGFGAKNWSLKLFIRFMKMWQDKYPVRVRRIYMVNTPVYFWAIAKFVMTFTSRKFQDRFKFLNEEELSKIVPKFSLPPCVGGTFDKVKEIVPWMVERLEERSGDSWASMYEM